MDAGGVFAVTAGLLYLVDSPSLEANAARGATTVKEESFAAMALVPNVSPEAAGIALRGRF